MSTTNAAWPDGHPWVRLTVGRRGSGKSYTMAKIMDSWRALPRDQIPGAIHAIDPVATNPPQPHHIAYHADTWSPVMDEIPEGTALLVLDEADTSIGQGAGRRHPAVEDLVRRGRHRNISLLLGTQRPALLMYDVWALADEVLICHTTSRRDLDRLAELDDQVAALRPNIARPGAPGVRVVWHGKLGVHAIGPP